jgi:hypothetical protein
MPPSCWEGSAPSSPATPRIGCFRRRRMALMQQRCAASPAYSRQRARSCSCSPFSSSARAKWCYRSCWPGSPLPPPP